MIPTKVNTNTLKSSSSDITVSSILLRPSCWSEQYSLVWCPTLPSLFGQQWNHFLREEALHRQMILQGTEKVYSPVTSTLQDSHLSVNTNTSTMTLITSSSASDEQLPHICKMTDRCTIRPKKNQLRKEVLN